MRVNWTPDLIEKLRALLAAGSTSHDAAKQLGIGYSAVENTISRYRLRDGARAATPAAVSASVTPEPPDPLQLHVAMRAGAQARSERKELLERLEAAEKRNKFWADIHASPIPPDIPRRELTSGLREGTAVALLSDAHIEELVEPVKVADRNAYNLEISERRMLRFFEGVKWLIEFNRGAWLVRDLILWLGGDLMTGYIHDELIESNLLSPVETVITLRQRLRTGLNLLLSDTKLERIVVPTNYGNHGRLGQKRRIKTGAENSFEWMLYCMLAEDYENEPRIRFEVPRGAHTYVTAYDRTLHFTHGDEVMFAGGVGGLAVPLRRRIPKWDNVKRSDIHHCGHYHSLIDLGNMLVNGSVIGYTEYALSIGADFEPPQQLFYMLDSKRGKTNVAPIWVGEVE